MKLQYSAAFDFYQTHINRSDLFKLLKDHNLKTTGSVPSITWELFGSILTGKKGSSGYGADLEGVEIKSATTKGSFEYQYHLNTGLAKLEEDQIVDHFFCSYSPDYRSFRVYYIPGKTLALEYFKKWIPLYKENYNTKKSTKTSPSNKPRQRFRKSVSLGFVTSNGILVMEVKDGKLIFTK